MLDEIEGSVQGHRDGHGFVQRDDGEADIYLPPNEMRAVLHKDRVKARVVRQDRRGRPEGRVVEIVERPEQPIIGRLLHEGGIWLVAPEDKRYGQDVLIPKGATGTAKVGQVVVVQLTEPPALFGQPVGRVKEVLGEIDDPGMEIEIAVRKYGVPHEFSEACLAEAKSLPDTVRPADKKGRIDLTDVPLVTIDGEDARDFDDAVYCEPAKVGRGKGWRLLVAIADVSSYVQTGSGIDIDAYDRATSVYFPRRVIPMLPEKLSNGLCSLNPEVERLCMVCDMLVAADGEIYAYQFYPAVMFSHARFTYTEVAAILVNTRGPEAAKRKDRVKDLLNLSDVYKALLKQRGKRGAVDFETTETQIICDDAGRIEKIVPRTRNEAHRLIEEAMLAANVCSADFIAEGVDQTRGWFFTLHALAVMLEDSVAFKNVIANGLVLAKDGQKMSKSLGNMLFVRELLKTYSADAIRVYLLSHHYRAGWDADNATPDLQKAEAMVTRWRNALALPSVTEHGSETLNPMPYQETFSLAMDDDLSTPRALEHLDELADFRRHKRRSAR